MVNAGLAGLSRRRWLWLELAAITAVCFIPQLWVSVEAYIDTAPPFHGVPLWAREISLAIIPLARLVPALFIVGGGAGEGLVRFGWSKFGFAQGLALILGGLLLCFFLALATASLYSIPANEHFIPGRHYAWDPVVALLAVTYICLRCTLEEFTLRGYLLVRLDELSGSRWLSVAVSSALYGAIHLSEGVASFPFYFTMGLFFVASRRMTGSIWPAVIVMVAANSIGYVASHLG